MRSNYVYVYTDFRKLRSHYPDWEIKKPLEAIIDEIVDSCRQPSLV